MVVIDKEAIIKLYGDPNDPNQFINYRKRISFINADGRINVD